jgi:formylmethanofuran dehydrogenase subunit E
MRHLVPDNFETPIEDESQDRRYKSCKCYKCNEVGTCSPSNDYYTTPESNGKLVCESCLRDGMMTKGIKPLNF